jgi:hypothetical protein
VLPLVKQGSPRFDLHLRALAHLLHHLLQPVTLLPLLVQTLWSLQCLLSLLQKQVCHCCCQLPAPAVQPSPQLPAAVLLCCLPLQAPLLP